MGIEHEIRNRKARTALVVCLVPTCCFAHGEQALVLPFCNVVALVGFVVFILLWRAGGLRSLCAFGLFVLGIILSWVLPLMPHTIADLAGCSFLHIFLVGFGVPAITVALGCLVLRAFGSAGRRNAQLGAAPNGGPAKPLGNSGASGGPPSVS
jgi:hypothetical protein